MNDEAINKWLEGGSSQSQAEKIPTNKSNLKRRTSTDEARSVLISKTSFQEDSSIRSTDTDSSAPSLFHYQGKILTASPTTMKKKASVTYTDGTPRGFSAGLMVWNLDDLDECSQAQPTGNTSKATHHR